MSVVGRGLRFYGKDIEINRSDQLPAHTGTTPSSPPNQTPTQPQHARTVEEPRLLPSGLRREGPVDDAAPEALRRGHLDLVLELEELPAREGHDAVPRADVGAPVLDGALGSLEGAQPLVPPDFDGVARVPREPLDEGQEGGRAAEVELSWGDGGGRVWWTVGQSLCC